MSDEGFTVEELIQQAVDILGVEGMKRAEYNWPETPPSFDPPLDPGIELGVRVLVAAGIETYESCEGGPGHAYEEPTIRFHGGRTEGFKALDAALQHRLPVAAIRRVWNIIDGEPTGPTWEMVFWRKLDRNVRGPFFRVVVNDEDNNG